MKTLLIILILSIGLVGCKKSTPVQNSTDKEAIKIQSETINSLQGKLKACEEADTGVADTEVSETPEPVVVPTPKLLDVELLEKIKKANEELAKAKEAVEKAEATVAEFKKGDDVLRSRIKSQNDTIKHLMENKLRLEKKINDLEGL